jgi:hypothetical protein
MLMRKVTAILMSISVLSVLATSPARAAAPEGLRDVLIANECQDLFEHPQIRRFGDPWWVSLRDITGDGRDYALFCQNDGDDVSVKLMLVIQGSRNPWAECSVVVNSWRGQRRLPYRYSVKVLQKPPENAEELHHWWLVSTSSDPAVTHGAVGTKVVGPIIDTTINSGTLYACVSGNWYQIGLD